MKITDVIGQLTSAYNDWNKYLANPNYYRSHSYISWNGCEKFWHDEAITYGTFFKIVFTPR